MPRKSAAATLPRRPCRRCGANFVPKRSNQVYCIDACRIADYQEKYYSPPKVTKRCPWCDEEFETSAPKKTVYCPEKGCQREHAIDEMRKARVEYKRLKELENKGELARR